MTTDQISAKKRMGIKKAFLSQKALFIMLIPGALFFIIFQYIPLLGSVIAFQDYNIYKGILHSPWVWFREFSYVFETQNFMTIFINNIIISLYQIVLMFPAPIILALMLNEVRSTVFKRIVQTMVYLPHFLSWAVVAGLAYMLLSSQVGLVNGLLVKSGLLEQPVQFLQSPEYVRGIIVGAGIWKETGWNTIIFLAVLTSISPSLYEAAKIDGAGRLKQCLYVTLPGLMPAIVTLLLLKIGTIMQLGFEQVYPFINPLTASRGEVFDTYTYTVGIVYGQYSITTAVGLFKSVIGFMLLVIFNRVSKATTGESII